jgi:hypothetical protein
MAAHVWNGSTWLAIKRLHSWNGSAWTTGNRRVWNSASWAGFQDDITLTNDIVTRNTGAGAVGTASWELNTSGNVRYNNLGANERFNQYLWSLNGTPLDENTYQYEVYADQTSGAALGGSALDQWLSLDVNRTWSLTSSSDADAVIDITIRNISTQQTFATCTINLVRLTTA